MSMEPVRVGLLSVGGWSFGHAKAALALDEVEVVAWNEPSDEWSAKFAELCSLPKSDSAESVCADKRVEAVVSGTPNHVHLTHGLLAAKHGKHLLVEKPMTNRLDEALQLAEAARKAGILVCVGHNRRRNPGLRLLKRMVDGGELGRVVTGESAHAHSGGMRMKPEHWRYHRDKCSCGPLAQLGVHEIETLMHILGPVTEVTAMFDHLACPGDNWDATSCIMRFASGPIVTLSCNYDSPPVGFVNLHGTGASARCDLRTGFHIWRAGEKEPQQLDWGEGVDTLREQMGNFARAVRGLEEYEVGLDKALLAVAVMEGAIRSAEEGRTISVERELGVPLDAYPLPEWPA